MARIVNRISTHILDTSRGKPAANVTVRLQRKESSGDWRDLGSSTTDADGRCGQLLPENATFGEGHYRLLFDTASYFAQQQTKGLYPVVEITFQARSDDMHFHIPLLLSPNGYTTYRGS
jgi:5-hydroxyisourate hydrolase